MATVADNHHQEEENVIHFAARESEVVLKWVVVLSGLATIGTLITFWMLAWIPALIFVGSLVLLLISEVIERRSETPAETDARLGRVRGERTVKEDRHLVVDPQSRALVQRESTIGMGILIGVGVLAIGVALALALFGIVPLKWVLVAGFFVFCYMLLVAAPLWLGWIEDDIEDETARMQQ